MPGWWGTTRLEEEKVVDVIEGGGVRVACDSPHGTRLTQVEPTPIWCEAPLASWNVLARTYHPVQNPVKVRIQRLEMSMPQSEGRLADIALEDKVAPFLKVQTYNFQV